MADRRAVALSAPDTPQVAWIAIERNAQVVGSDGEAVGKVSEVVGDPDADVFTGLSVSLGAVGANRLVPSERVGAIWPDRVEVGLTKAEIEALPAYQEQVSERLQPPDDFFTRLRRWWGGGGRTPRV